MNADTAEGFEPVMELHASEGPVRSLTILRGQTSNDGETPNPQRRQIQVLLSSWENTVGQWTSSLEASVITKGGNMRSPFGAPIELGTPTKNQQKINRN